MRGTISPPEQAGKREARDAFRRRLIDGKSEEELDEIKVFERKSRSHDQGLHHRRRRSRAEGDESFRNMRANIL
jgi:hypothetical protein